MSLLSSVFYKDNVFVDLRPDGNPFSIDFLKFVKRILSKFPVTMPEEHFVEADSERQRLINIISFYLSFVKTKIQPCFKTKKGNPNDDVGVSKTVSKQELTHLWMADQKRAIDVLKNDGKDSDRVHCDIDLTTVQNHFTNSCSKRLDGPVNDPPWGAEALPPPPQYQLPETPISESEVRCAINKTPNKKSPGVDGVTYETFKKHINKLAPPLTAIFNVCITHRRVPAAWKHGVISLLSKTLRPSAHIEDWRPISLLLSSYKLFMSVIQTRIMPWIVNTQRLSCRQKGSLPRNGLQEHVYCLKTAINDFFHQSSKMFITFVDLKDAFGSLDHDVMIQSLQQAGYPDYVIDLTRDIYNGSTFQVKTGQGITDNIPRHRGIIQGDPWSVICFEQGIDTWLRWMDDKPPTHLPCPVQGYVDDVGTIATTEKDELEMARKSGMYMDTTGLEAKHRKCAVLHGQRSGNNWAKNSRTGDIQVSIQNAQVPVYPRDKHYPYLGYEMRIDNMCTQTTDLITGFNDMLNKIDVSLLPTSAKLEAINVLCMSRLSFTFPNLIYLEKQLAEVEKSVVEYARHWLCLNDSSTRAYFFTPKSRGGLGLINPRVMYYAKHLAFRLEVLNSDDITVRHTARESLKLHMTKRKAQPCDRDEDNFAGYKVENSKIVKASKINWPKSDWYHLFDMCQRENIQLIYRQSDERYAYVITCDDDISVIMAHSKPFYNMFKQMKLTQFEEKWQSLHSQGRVIREVVKCTDHRSSSSFLGNHMLSDDLRSFVCRGRLQLLQCNSLLHLYYAIPKHCRLCGFRSDTASHILNGCPKLKNMYQKRHDRIVSLIHDKIVGKSKSDTVVLKDTFLTPDKLDSQLPRFEHPHTRPDIVCIDNKSRTVTLIEVAVPFDAHIDKTYTHKFDKYYPLSLEINQLDFSTRIIVLIVGSLGNVHKRFISGLKLLNLSNTDAKFMAKYCSVSAIIGSHMTWKIRCKQLPQF